MRLKSLIALVILITTYYDAKRDKENLTRNGWPRNGFRILRKGYSLKRQKPNEVYPGDYDLFLTIDRRHITKWLSFYPPMVLLWAMLWPCRLLMLVLPIATSLVWKFVKKPPHWE
jgi:hypothetical protein